MCNENLDELTEQEKMEFDEFEKMLNEFIEGEFEKELNKQDDEEETTEETEDDEESSEEEDVSIPDGEIEQNQGLSVKVSILRPIANPREELDKLVGCEEIKRRMDELVALTKYNSMMLEAFPDSKLHEVSLHSIFFGRPGTGKTTVCKIYGSLLRQAGMLSSGHVVVCNRGTFVGNNWGDEDKAVRSVLELAKGGVLMIDEAYLLNSNHPNDPGKLVIPLLMDILANEDRRDLAIILCGYKDEMLRLIDLNPGLDSRFPNRFEFPDFTVDDLLEITRRRIREYGYSFTRSAWQKYRQLIAKAYAERDKNTWGNARFVANQLELIYLRHAHRCLRLPFPQRQQLLSLTTADIEPLAPTRPKPKIGF
jgi:SpoVK/Ycf46/Vps4 family AAA+-type ATPase